VRTAENVEVEHVANDEQHA